MAGVSGQSPEASSPHALFCGSLAVVSVGSSSYLSCWRESSPMSKCSKSKCCRIFGLSCRQAWTPRGMSCCGALVQRWSCVREDHITESSRLSAGMQRQQRIKPLCGMGALCRALRGIAIIQVLIAIRCAARKGAYPFPLRRRVAHHIVAWRMRKSRPSRACIGSLSCRSLLVAYCDQLSLCHQDVGSSLQP